MRRVSLDNAVMTKIEDGGNSIGNAESRSGTLVNGSQFTGPALLRSRECIKLPQSNHEIQDFLATMKSIRQYQGIEQRPSPFSHTMGDT